MYAGDNQAKATYIALMMDGNSASTIDGAGPAAATATAVTFSRLSTPALLTSREVFTLVSD